MRSKRVLENSQHWLDRAGEARTRAEQILDSESKGRMLGIAEGYEKLARRAETRAGMKFDPKLDVQVAGDSIIITLLGTIYSVTYFNRRGSPGLLAKHIPNKDDPHVSMTCPDFLASAWRAANDRARELGWVAVGRPFT
jgi:hypothetical protein